MDKRLKTAQLKTSSAKESEFQKQTVYRQHWLPWLLLAFSWLGAGLYFYLG
jgi:hypothetical protein